MSTPLFTSLSLTRVRNPQLILRQVVFQFVTANGARFVDANPWVKELLLERKGCTLPSDVHIYLFAIHGKLLKTSGISGHVVKNAIRVLSEFTFWPLGTVLSWGELDEPGLTDIRDWAELPFNSGKKLDLQLIVKPCSSPFPADFRLRSQIMFSASVQEAPEVDESLVEEMQRLVRLRSGAEQDEFCLTAHPAQAMRLKQTCGPDTGEV